MNLVPVDNNRKVDFFGMHIKFQGDQKSIVANQLLTTIEVLEKYRYGYKIFGKEGRFPTPRCVVYSVSYKTLSDLAQKLAEQFKATNCNVGIVLYSNSAGDIQYHRTEGIFDKELYTEIEDNISMGDMPINT